MREKDRLHRVTSLLKHRGILFAIIGVAVIGVITLVLTHATTVTTLDINDNTTGTDANQWQYAGTGWGYYSGDSNKFQGDDHSSSATGDTATLKFTGISVAYYGAKSPQAGIVGISIDGGTESMVDLYSATRFDNTLLYTSPTLASGDHILKDSPDGQQECQCHWLGRRCRPRNCHCQRSKRRQMVQPGG